MSRSHWYIVAAAGALLVLWFFFVRQPAALRPPVASSNKVIPPQSSTGIVGQITDGVAKARSAWASIFGTSDTGAVAAGSYEAGTP